MIIQDENIIKKAIETKQLKFNEVPYPTLKERIFFLKKLKKSIQNHEEDIIQSLHEDFNKPHLESYVTEISLVYQEINHTIKHLKDWMRIKKVSTPIYLFPSKSRYRYTPKGVVLILGPWNYPFLLIMDPLVNAYSAGNNVLLKLPNQTPHTSDMMEKIISEVFEKDQVSTIRMKDEDVIPKLIEPNTLNHIFFTGSERVGKLIYAAAAKSLTPVTLELGGKSPCIVDETANIPLAAKKIMWAKMINAGQTCVAPDYILVHQSVKELLIQELKKNITQFHSKKSEADFAHLIHDKHFEGLVELLKDKNIVAGGKTIKETRYFEPTIVEISSLEDSLMQREIFGPILPLLTYDTFDEVKPIIELNANPLALYFFSKNRKRINSVLKDISFGGACINDCLLHLGVPDLAFGGIGSSGFGNYHGFDGFQTFSHKKSYVKSSSWLDIPIKYPPYSESKLNLLKRFLKF